MTSVTARFPGRALIDAYGNGGFRFAGMSHRGSILCLPSGIYASSPSTPRCASLDPAFAEASVPLASDPRYGGANEGRPSDVRRAFARSGLGLEAMNTGAACRTYNVLLGEGRPVGAALVAVDERPRGVSGCAGGPCGERQGESDKSSGCRSRRCRCAQVNPIVILPHCLHRAPSERRCSHWRRSRPRSAGSPCWCRSLPWARSRRNGGAMLSSCPEVRAGIRWRTLRAPSPEHARPSHLLDGADRRIRHALPGRSRLPGEDEFRVYVWKTEGPLFAWLVWCLGLPASTARCGWRGVRHVGALRFFSTCRAPWPTILKGVSSGGVSAQQGRISAGMQIRRPTGLPATRPRLAECGHGAAFREGSPRSPRPAFLPLALVGPYLRVSSVRAMILQEGAGIVRSQEYEDCGRAGGVGVCEADSRHSELRNKRGEAMRRTVWRRASAGLLLNLSRGGAGVAGPTRHRMGGRESIPLFPRSGRYRGVVGDLGELSPEQRTKPVLSAERVLAERHPEGWSATMFDKTCWDDERNRYACGNGRTT